MKKMQSKAMAKNIAKAGSEKKASGIVIMDMKKLTTVVDYFVILSASSNTNAKAIADNIEEKLAEKGVELLHREGYRDSKWILLDFGACAANIFVGEERQFYDLEKLWLDAPQEQYE